ncbi:amino acid permease [Ancylomarina sp. 16SWW S1-10-2]|uniref:amino acid permease n=1 Tax=Ancylomarina sp. 16SWW S1-10-2 TaxID=2499681 RepID=UPI0012AE6E03|nr:amino acid permease [Ancylomarina sp. 16SWW S1-10-2]MRT93926.1 amino acid permease [Ancylomarina sp. 16SWW S1-10-2]
MAKAKKFGTFGGVFTPSILTILGVIMYLRFPAIIGQAGLINTIGIIFIAHIISITTSLSVASLSTDKPVQNGGTYFMISRSLGLPIGGTLGLALFVGLSFSVSLYLIGFSESFLQYWGIANNIANIRIAGTIVLVAVTTITFISTSLAIKSQYFIMGTIVLSLFSIVLGNHDFAPTTVNLKPLATSAPFMLLFGIFFPAVTGFEAGVSMSGDLENPRKSLPLGAVMAVGVGFVVYIALAFFYAFTVNSDALANDPDILFKISLVPQLVIAGIWGATLSSALGSILGAPRILQAIAMDKIAHRVFAKGTGATNEPRNALLVAFVIAEVGILIGELDVIARIVSMFFITTYAFLNLASAIESWSSSDFRPAFKIPRFVSILGALSAFIVMILLDFMALAGATIVLGLLYFYLQRKELILETGDAWSSFWTNMAKKALLKLSVQKVNTRNWQPNIILFSGGENARPHLIEMGLSLTGKLGALTDFKLLVGQDSKPVRELSVDQRKLTSDYFTRQYSCKTIEDGMKTVTNAYGFTGFEPNTILMGWSKDLKNAEFLTHVLKDFKSKGLNAIFLNYNKEVGFGKKQNIDIWWNGKGRILNLGLQIIKFLLIDPKWRDAKIRILIINNNTFVGDTLQRDIKELLVDRRIAAEIKIIGNDFGTRTKESIINTESNDADLVLLGLSQKSEAYSSEYINTVNELTELSASLLFLSPSDEFDVIDLISPLADTKTTEPAIVKNINLPSIPEIDNTLVKANIVSLETKLTSVTDAVLTETLLQTVDSELSILKSIRDFAIVNQSKLESELTELDKHEYEKTIRRNHQSFLRSINKIIEVKNPQTLLAAQKAITAGISELIAKKGNLIYETPEQLMVTFVEPNKGKEISSKLNYKKAIEYYLNTELVPKISEQLMGLDDLSIQLFTTLRKFIFGINDQYEKLLLQKDTVQEILAFDLSENLFELKKLEDELIEFKDQCSNTITRSVRQVLIVLAEDLFNPKSIKNANTKFKSHHIIQNDYLASYADNWETAVNLINTSLYLDILIISQQKIGINLLLAGNERMSAHINELVINPILKLAENIDLVANTDTVEVKSQIFPDNLEIQSFFNESYTKLSKIIEELPESMQLPTTIYKNSKAVPFSELTSIDINLRKIGSHSFDTLFYEPFYREVLNLRDIVSQATIECRESSSLLQFRLSNRDQQSDILNEEQNQQEAFYQSLKFKVVKEKEKVEEALLVLDKKARDLMLETFSNLFYHAILESEKKISTLKRENNNKKISKTISVKYHLLKNKINNVIIQLLNHTSSGIILSKKYLTNNKPGSPDANDILDIIDQLTPNPKVYQRVPVFYRSLLSGSSKISDEFWVGRDAEYAKIKQAMQRHTSGINGAVLIHGVHGSGKTALSRYAASNLVKKSNVFWIDPPIKGSVDPKVLLTKMQQQVVNMSNFNAIFNSIPHNSMVIMNDIELWWERNHEGSKVLKQIIEIIEKFSNKVFFVLNCNTYAYQVMKEVLPLQEHLLSVVECGNFNTGQLQKLIINRHKSSGLKINYQGKEEEDISPLNLSLLFNAYFSFTKGVPGMALTTWKANIIESEHGVITIKKPSRPNTDLLMQLDAEILTVIALFIQHKNIDNEKLMRITGFDNSVVDLLLLKLFNFGLIVKTNNDTYCLGRNIEPFMVETCINKGII